jgi:type I restriction enzyme S subunit
MYNIEDGEIVWKDIKRMELTDEEIDKYKLEPGDFLVNRVNSKKLVGKAAPIPAGLETCVYESKNIRVRLDNDFEPKYLHYWFHIFRRRYFTNILQQTVGQASITQKQIQNMPLPIPPAEEQSEIVNRVESCLSIVDEVKKSIQTENNRSESLKQSLLKEAFRGNLLSGNVDENSLVTKSGSSEAQGKLVQQKLHQLNEETDD